MTYPRSNDKSVAKLAVGLRAYDFFHCTRLKVTQGLNEKPADGNIQVTESFFIRWSGLRGQRLYLTFFSHNLTQLCIAELKVFHKIVIKLIEMFIKLMK